MTLSYPIFTFQGVNMDTNAQKIQADLKEVGINVTLNGQELQVELDNYRNGTEAFGYWFWGPDFLDPADVLSFLPGEKVGLRAGWAADGADQSILDLDAQAKVETDPAKRTEIFDKIQDYLLSEWPLRAVHSAERPDGLLAATSQVTTGILSGWSIWRCWAARNHP